MGNQATSARQREGVDRQIISTLNELIETSKDGEKGFALAANDTKEPRSRCYSAKESSPVARRPRSCRIWCESWAAILRRAAA